MRRAHNVLLGVAVVVLAAVPLVIVDHPDGQATEVFAGADETAKKLIGEIRPDYRPWFEPLIEPASGEIASLLFALQAAIGAGFIGYYLGVASTREKMRREAARKQNESAPEE